MSRGKRQYIVRKVSWVLMLLSFLKGFSAAAQDKMTVPATGNFQGIIIDNDTKERLAVVVIHDINSHRVWFNTLKGEFKIDVQIGDKLVFTKEDYHPDTLVVGTLANIIVYMQRTAIMLHEVTITDSLHTPLQKLIASQREFSKIYSPRLNPDAFSSIPGGGAGISLDAIYNSFSREGRDAAQLRTTIQGDYQQNVIDYRFSKSSVGNITKLKDQELVDFMRKYRPSYYLVTNYTEYEFINYIRTSLKRYLRNKRAFTQPALKPPQS
ncbi:MAG: hypothetical protein ACXVIY_04100 [Mucilaginibacter sp.]